MSDEMKLASQDRVVVVTGAAGWLGSRLVEHLAAGHPDHPDLAEMAWKEVRCLLRQGEDAPNNGELSIVRGDVTRLDDCRRLLADAQGGVLIHTAGIIHPKRAREFFDVNLDGTKNLLQAAGEAKLKRVVVVSSNSPCGCNPFAEHRFDEQSPYNPYMGYGRSKMLMELAVKAFAKDSGVETCIIRAPWFYGVNQPARQTLFFSMIKNGKVPIVGGGENLRSMAYVDNLTQGLMLAGLHKQSSGQLYWIADERPYSMNEIVDTVADVLSKDFSMEVSPKRLALPGIVSELALLADMLIQGVGLYQQKIHVLSEMNKHIACSVELAKRELGFMPKVELREGMRRSIEWCLSKGHKI